MKKLLLLTFTVCFWTTCFGQQFSFQINFVDAAGNKDSLILGYDPTGSDTIDPSFGETNIFTIAYNSGLDVRAGNSWWKENSLTYANENTHQTKTQIVNGTCGANFPIEIDVVTDNFPVKAYWNKFFFQNTCRNGSVFTSVTPFGWWDTGGFIEVLKTEDSTTFFSNQYNFVQGTDTVPVYWIAFGDSTLLLSSISENTNSNQSLEIFPNPTSTIINLKIAKQFGQLKSVEIYSSIGMLLTTSEHITTFDLTKFEKGIYFIVVTNERGEKIKSIVMKV